MDTSASTEIAIATLAACRTIVARRLGAQLPARASAVVARGAERRRQTLPGLDRSAALDGQLRRLGLRPSAAGRRGARRESLEEPDTARVPKRALPARNEAVVAARGALPPDGRLVRDDRLNSTGARPTARAAPTRNRGRGDGLAGQFRNSCHDCAEVLRQAATRARMRRDPATLIEEVGEIADPSVAHERPFAARPDGPIRMNVPGWSSARCRIMACSMPFSEARASPGVPNRR